jgi:rhodanese-related sulfurtransferase
MTVMNVTPQEARSWLVNGKAILVDVREPDEFARLHIPGAAPSPLASLRDELRKMALPADRAIIFQCQKGGRGGQACEAVSSGTPDMPRVFNLAGGIDAWQAAGLPVTTGAAPGIPIMRQVQMIAGSLVATGVATGFLVHPAGFAFAGLIGAALATAGLTGWCGMAILLRRAPWNSPR